MRLSSRIAAIVAAATIPSLSALAQDECSTATTIAIGPNGPFDSTGSTVSTPAFTCQSNVQGGDVWYTFTLPAGPMGTLTVDTEGSAFDTVLELWDACGGTSIACDDDGGTGLLSSITIAIAGGSTVYARVGGYNTAVGMHNVNVAFDSPDECAGALAIVDGVNGPFDTTGATTSTPPSTCSSLNSDIWLVHTASCDGMLTVETSSAGVSPLSDTVMEAWDACGGTVLACDDDGGPGLFSRVTIPVLAGVDYYFRVGDFGATSISQGLFLITVTNAPSPGGLNDECACAYPVVDGANGPYDSTGSTRSNPSWPCGFVSTSGGDIWFTYTAVACGDLTIDTIGTTFDTVLQAFSGTCGSLTSVACNDDIGGGTLQSSVTIPGVVAGDTLVIRAAGYNTNFGPINLNITNAPLSINDECATALAISLGVNPSQNNACATTSVETWPCGFGVANDLWYSFTASADGPYTFRTCGGDYDTVLEVLDGACGALTSLACNDDASSGPCGLRQSSATVTLTMGTTYYVRVGGYNGATGNAPVEVVPGNGTGTIVNTTASLCTVPGLELSFSGVPAIGSSVTTTLNGTTGIGFLNLDLFAPTPALSPACPCLVLGPGGWLFSSSVTLTVPFDISFFGLPVQAQGADLLGSPSACPFAGVDTAFTDVWTITIN
ncbi:MAG: hypothetical protein KDE27_25485 [Planctomycetes bacterium]|nr:hypothetical protein [Planctomycetota bacterium]